MTFLTLCKIVFFGLFCVNYFVGFPEGDFILAIVAGIIAIVLIVKR